MHRSGDAWPASDHETAAMPSDADRSTSPHDGTPPSRHPDDAPPPREASTGSDRTVRPAPLPRDTGHAAGHTAAHRTGCAVAAVVVALWVASLVTVLVAFPDGRAISSDEGAPSVPHWVVVLPAIVAIAMALWLPPRSPARPVSIERRGRLLVTTCILLALAALFPILSLLGLLEGEAYVLGKLALFIVLPVVLVVSVRGAVRIDRAPALDRWLQPLAIVVVWTVLAKLAPWNPEHEFGAIDPLTLLIVASATAVTAGFGEELFYRRLLQTRLEAALGAPGGIALATLAFALMHVGSHGSGEPLLDIAQVVVAQGSFGALAGVLWWRYRNLAAIVALHVIANGWEPAAALLG